MQVGHLDGVEVAGLDLAADNVGRKDREAEVAADGFLDRLVAAKLKGDAHQAERRAGGGQPLLETGTRRGTGLAEDERLLGKRA